MGRPGVVVRCLLLVAAAGWAFGNVAAQPVARHPARLIVRLQDGVVSAAAAGAKLQAVSRELGVYTMQIQDGGDPAKKAREIAALPGVQYAELDLAMVVAGRSLAAAAAAAAASPPPPAKRRPPAPQPQRFRRPSRRPAAVTPNDALWSQQWGPAMMSAPAGWALARDASNVPVCMVDSGVKWDHPDLAGSLMPMSPGYQAAHSDAFGHGTHVAGIIGAVAANGLGVAGLAYKATLLVCKALDSRGVGYVSDVIRCVDSCRSMGARVINLSMVLQPAANSDNLRSLNASMKATTEAGVFITSAAGNSELDLDVTPVYPGSFGYPGLVAVANVQRDGSLDPTVFGLGASAPIYGSNFGARSVQLAAPGTAILSTYFQSAWNGSYYQWMTGTSMAAPAVAGAAALVLAASGGKLSNVQLQQLLIRTSRPLPALQGRVVSGGVVDLFSALREARAYA